MKTEASNEMFLYTCGNAPNADTLAMFCSEQKAKFQSGAFHFIVFFDDKASASFPTNPLIGGYIEEEQLKHVKAEYTYNHINGYSKLATYSTNAWEGKPSEIDVR